MRSREVREGFRIVPIPPDSASRRRWAGFKRVERWMSAQLHLLLWAVDFIVKRTAANGGVLLCSFSRFFLGRTDPDGHDANCRVVS